MSEKGKVKFYNKERGFGFIETDTGDVHFGKDSFKGDPPENGDLVEFEIAKQSKGKHAKNLKIINQINYKIPSDTNKYLKNFKNIDNFNLKLNKLANLEEKFLLFQKDRKGNIKYKVVHNFDKNFITEISNNYYLKIEKLHLIIKPIEAKPQWKMVIGLGSPSVYETSMTLHHIYGFPYIPGQAIKGVVRNYIIQEVFDCSENDALKNNGFINIFGSQKNKGKIIFFDAYPLEPPQIDVDVMNVHYKDYYEGKSAPADYLSPTPIYFLVVKETEFRFIIGAKKKEIFDCKIENRSIFEWFKKALMEQGIGAKTSVGYGYFEEINND